MALLPIVRRWPISFPAQCLRKRYAFQMSLSFCPFDVRFHTVSPAEETDIDYVVPSEKSFSGRTGSARENADLICFLASDNAAYINGQNIQIDGCRKIIQYE